MNRNNFKSYQFTGKSKVYSVALVLNISTGKYISFIFMLSSQADCALPFSLLPRLLFRLNRAYSFKFFKFQCNLKDLNIWNFPFALSC